ncbi:MAG: DUF4886 domain-containing protein [Deinococcota bacterium]
MKVLFIGNSYTEHNSLHKMFSSICEHGGIDAETRLVTADGMTLSEHYYEASTHSAIESDDWDFILLQEQSIVPSETPLELQKSVKRFSDSLYGKTTKLALYSTWARKFLPQIQNDIDQTYSRAAEACSAVLIPVGKAWSISRTQHQALELYADDQSHPSWLGTYLAACVTYMKLTGKFPSPGSNVIDVDSFVQVAIEPTTAQALQDCAAQAVGLDNY